MKKGIWWIKRDMRIRDNQALFEAVQECEEVLAVFCFEPSLIQSEETSGFHYNAWIQALKEVKKSVEKIGGCVYISRKEVQTTLQDIKEFYDFTHLYSHQETGTNITFSRDKTIKKWCNKNNIVWREFAQNGVVRKLQNIENRKKYWKERIIDTEEFPKIDQINCSKKVESQCQYSLPRLQGNPYAKDAFPVQIINESQAQKTLNSFLSYRGYGYSGGISSPNTAFESGSRLSPHLAWGTISLRQCFQQTYQRMQELKQQKEHIEKKLTARETEEYKKQRALNIRWRRSLNSFESRLHWKDHFTQRLETDVSMEYKMLNPAYETIEYRNEPVIFGAWYSGNTGYPMIDAVMRCLHSTGFINFRMRAMVVSFACFGLHLDWRYIAAPLARVFLDYEPGIHYSQLQMQAGITGINAVRVYSPTKQILDQDPDCQFIKTWIPELRGYAPAEIINYESQSLGEYPKPIVDFQAQSKAMKAQVFAIRKTQEGKAAAKKVYEKHGSRLNRGRKRLKKDSNQQSSLFE